MPETSTSESRLAEIREQRLIMELRREERLFESEQRAFQEQELSHRRGLGTNLETLAVKAHERRRHDMAAAAEADFPINESAGVFDYYDFFDQSPYGYSAGQFGPVLGSGGNVMLNPVSTRMDRRQGRMLPFLQTEQDLMLARGVARIICTLNCPAQGVLNALTNYVIGEKGFRYTVDVKHVHKKDEMPDGLIEAVQDTLDRFMEANHWTDLEAELFNRSRRDGEYFLSLNESPGGGTKVCVIEPEQVTQAASEQWTNRRIREEHGQEIAEQLDWYWGVLTPLHNSTEVYGFNTIWLTDDGSMYYAADTVQHFKLSDRNVKRGLSDFYPAFRMLTKSGSLANKIVSGAAVQAGIAYIRQHPPGRTQSDVTAWRATQANSTTNLVNPFGGNQTVYNQYRLDSQILDVPAGQEYLSGPMGSVNGPQFIEVLQAALRWVAVKWNAPEWIVSGDASNGNFASSLVAESPFCKTVQRMQNTYGPRWVAVMWKVIEHACAWGRFDRFGEYGSFEALRHRIIISVSYPRVETRDPTQETQRLKTLCDDGIIAPGTRAAEEGYDLDRELAKKPPASQRPAEVDAKASSLGPEGQVTGVQQGEDGGGEKQPEGDATHESFAVQPSAMLDINGYGDAARLMDDRKRKLAESAAILEGAEHAPKGDDTHLSGKTFKPGQFIPSKDVAKATPTEKAKLKKQQVEAKSGKGGNKPASVEEKPTPPTLPASVSRRLHSAENHADPAVRKLAVENIRRQMQERPEIANHPDVQRVLSAWREGDPQSPRRQRVFPDMPVAPPTPSHHGDARLLNALSLVQRAERGGMGATLAVNSLRNAVTHDPTLLDNPAVARVFDRLPDQRQRELSLDRPKRDIEAEREVAHKVAGITKQYHAAIDGGDEEKADTLLRKAFNVRNPDGRTTGGQPLMSFMHDDGMLATAANPLYHDDARRYVNPDGTATVAPIRFNSDDVRELSIVGTPDTWKSYEYDLNGETHDVDVVCGEWTDPNNNTSGPIAVFRWQTGDDDGQWTMSRDNAFMQAQHEAEQRNEAPPYEEIDEHDVDEPLTEEETAAIAREMKAQMAGEKSNVDAVALRKKTFKKKADGGEYGQTEANVKDGFVAGIGNIDKVSAQLSEAIGDHPTPRMVMSIAGMPDDAENIKVKIDGGRVRVEFSSDAIQSAKRIIATDGNGDVYVHNSLFVLNDEYRGSGIGSDMFGRQIEQATKFGAQYIECHAAGDGRGLRDGTTEFNGYYSWPRMGYDQSIDELEDGYDGSATAAKIRRDWPEAESILDIMATSAGRDWWLVNGSDLINATFDLSPKSRSLAVYNAYSAERQKRKEKAVHESAPGDTDDASAKTWPFKSLTSCNDIPGRDELALSAADEGAIEAVWKRIESLGWKRFMEHGMDGATRPIAESKDAEGHEHKGKGKGGGQFTSTGGGDAAKTDKEKTKKKKSDNAKQPLKSDSQPSMQDIEIADDDDEPTGGRFTKPKATRLQLVSAQKVGTGDKSKIVLADGREAPEHIQKLAGKIPPAWENVHVSLDPESDVQALGITTSKDGKQSGKALYSAGYNAKTAELKFLRVADMMSNWGMIEKETQRNRDDPKKRDLADATWLMMNQATRPGSESDSKGTKKLWGDKMTAKNVVLGSVNKDGVFHPGTEDKKTGQPHVCLKFGDTFVPIKDDDARKELLRRVKDKQPLFDAKFWLKSHGATTLEGRNVVQSKDGVRLQFMGKESVWHDHLIRDPALAKMLLERKAASGEEGKLFKASAERVRKYVSHLDGGDYLTKDLRTARANFIANAERSNADAPKTFDEYKQRVQEVAEKVAHVLGNRWQQSLETYIDPSIWTEWLASVPPETPKEPKPKKSKSKKVK